MNEQQLWKMSQCVGYVTLLFRQINEACKEKSCYQLKGYTSLLGVRFVPRGSQQDIFRYTSIPWYQTTPLSPVILDMASNTTMLIVPDLVPW